LKALPFIRGFRVQRKVNIVDGNIVILLQFFNTPGTEIAPGSNKIGVDIEDDGFGHIIILQGRQHQRFNEIASFYLLLFADVHCALW